jgi:hypothetical protein
MSTAQPEAEGWRPRRSHYRSDMSVTATFVNERIEVLPNVTTTLTVRLYNDDDASCDVALSASGDLASHTRLELSTASVETNQIVDVPVTVFVPPTVPAGTYALHAEARAGLSLDAPVAMATATIEVIAQNDYTIALQPALSKGSASGRHVIRAVNTGNVAVMIDLVAEINQIGDGTVAAAAPVSVELASAAITLIPGAAHQTAVRVVPAATFWSGPSREYGFVVQATSSDGRVDELVGTYEQRPRVPSWLGPAAAGAFAALLVGAIVWFAFLRPWVEDTADEAAAEAIEEDRAALRERIDELEATAAAARQLPLGAPVDFRLDVDPAAGNVEAATVSVAPGTVVSITDVVFQNPTGAVGTVSLRRGNEVILSSELANFRDFDLHFVAPYVFGSDDEIVLDVDCRTPGSGASTCPIGASLVGFVADN